jgi:hypothetical protein
VIPRELVVLLVFAMGFGVVLHATGWTACRSTSHAPLVPMFHLA